ncbi:unnamed protein product [Macrosiphum euphorbiae]|uniref:Uncharacterized protein n=1 Tax=Macrosiphum euphorbiae TaxID=13131 RepID=A0AAV0VT78_9HEMI|nr:unnamed protein product [Macrosiphum euphorbiae]
MGDIQAAAPTAMQAAAETALPPADVCVRMCYNSSEALAAQRFRRGRFGGGSSWKRRLHVQAAGNHPAARIRVGHGHVERGHGCSGHQ